MALQRIKAIKFATSVQIGNSEDMYIGPRKAFDVSFDDKAQRYVVHDQKTHETIWVEKTNVQWAKPDCSPPGNVLTRPEPTVLPADTPEAGPMSVSPMSVEPQAALSSFKQGGSPETESLSEPAPKARSHRKAPAKED